MCLLRLHCLPMFAWHSVVMGILRQAESNFLLRRPHDLSNYLAVGDLLSLPWAPGTYPSYMGTFSSMCRQVHRALYIYINTKLM